jgi:type III secretion system-like peptide-binding chaperone
VPVGKRAWFGAYVDRLLMEQFDTTTLLKDDDGDVPFSKGTSACFVSVERRRLGVRVWGMAAMGIKPTAAALREVNELNQQATLAKVVLAGDRVWVEVRLPADQVSARSLRRACQQVCTIADDIGSLFAGVYGGSTPFPVQAQAG